MIAKFKTHACRLAASSGLHRALHPWFNKNQLSVLMYHGVIDKAQPIADWCMLDKQRFRQQIRYLSEHFEIVSLDRAAEMVADNTIDGPTAVITFDDGYQNNYEHAYPVLKEFHAPATIFLATSLIDSDFTVWTGALHQLISEASCQELRWNGRVYPLSTLAQKEQAILDIKRQLKNLGYAKISWEAQQISSALGHEQHAAIDTSSPYHMLNSASIREMANDELITFGAHTHNHPILSRLSFAEQQEEIVTSLDRVKTLLGKPCRYFAYPNGTADDYNSDTLAILEKSNISVALTTIEGTSDSQLSPLKWRRFGIGSDMDFANFQLYVHNCFHWHQNRTRAS